MDFQKNRLVLESGGCQTDGKKKRVEINRPIEKNGGFFAGSVLKLEEIENYPLLSVGLYPATMGTGITRVSSPY
jgi:hypothetical protein